MRVCCVNCALSACGQRPKQSSLILADKTQRDPDYKLAPHTDTHTTTDMHILGSCRTRQVPPLFSTCFSLSPPFLCSSSKSLFLSLFSIIFFHCSFIHDSTTASALSQVLPEDFCKHFSHFCTDANEIRN